MKPTTFLFPFLTVLLTIGCTTPKPFLDQYETHTQFISKIGNQSSHTIRGFDLDQHGNIYISGTTFGSVEVCEIKYSGVHAGLLMKMGPDLTCQWSRIFTAKKDRATCFLREAVLDNDAILAPGICHGELHIEGVKQFDANGKFQSFITKIDVSGKVIWTERYFLEQDFIITGLIKTSDDTYTGIGIKDETITVLFEIDAQGKLGKTMEFQDTAKIYNNILLQRGNKLFQSSIGVRFVSIRELNRAWDVDWHHHQDTKCSLLAVKAHIGVDVRNGIWISVPFSTEETDFEFGKDKIKGTGLIDSYLTQYRNDEQIYSVHIKGKEDQIVTGFFDGNRKNLSFCLVHGKEFQIANHSYSKGAGISLIEFDIEKPDELVYSTFPIENKERDRMTNSGVYFRLERGKSALLGGHIIKGESQTTDPVLTVGDQKLVIKNPVFNGFLVKGVKKKKIQ